jgi:hypothetical protein
MIDHLITFHCVYAPLGTGEYTHKGRVSAQIRAKCVHANMKVVPNERVTLTELAAT